ncbi:putative RNA-directed DNA polymerase, eukaryota, reverse transcriptase zinc-binding domain protein [Tanacetum coccineum]|uniref:RNA-directed DNA polymerase, eukaryota, reverse transcriptase zinc-binding domain protein n=1 Tax=Tanacetum coccineum TaxID=301880 RepID=A0ABQ4XK19_9ASTR
MWIVVYAPQNLACKIALWSSMANIIANWNGILVAMGDFNEVRTASERFGSIFNERHAEIFNSFISNSILLFSVGVSPSYSFNFTWTDKWGSKMSKLDRFLVSDSFLDIFPNATGVVLEKGRPDHRPIFLKESVVDYGPTPFWFFHSWLELDGFHNLVIDTWNNDGIRDFLEQQCTREEIKKDVSDCGGDRAPGLDDFTSNFLTSFWNLLEADVVRFVNEFFQSGTFPKGCNSSFILLILRLSTVIGSCVSSEQTTFIKGRNILDGPLILNEIIAWYHKRKKELMVFKVDFEKAFDSVRWDFLDLVMDKLVFGLKWRSWIQGCLNKGRSSVLVNGSPTSEFEVFKGLRQGDPLSPFLFILVMEALHAITRKSVELGLSKGATVGQGNLSVSHLMYADDVIFLGDWSQSNVQNLLCMLRCFYLVSRLKINVHKSNITGVFVANEVATDMAKSVGCGVANFPLKYLGVPVGCNMSRCVYWNPIIHKFSSNLAQWKARLLSVGGRLSLIKSVLGNLPTYYMSLYMMPMTIQKKLEMMWNNFFIGGDEGLLFKWIWRFRCQSNDLWEKVIKSLYEINGGINDDRALSHSTWGAILSSVKRLKQNDQKDTWEWSLNTSIGFTVASVRTLIDANTLVVDSNATRWIRCVPIKVNIFLWRLVVNKLPTRVNLERKGIDVDSTLCPICGEDVETVNHIFFSCEMAKDLWALLARWWSLDIPICSNFLDWSSWLDSLHLSSKVKLFLKGVGGTLLWAIWNFRNRLVFSVPPPKKAVLWDYIVSQFFLWISSRNHRIKFSWVNWSQHPLVSIASM